MIPSFDFVPLARALMHLFNYLVRGEKLPCRSSSHNSDNRVFLCMICSPVKLLGPLPTCEGRLCLQGSGSSCAPSALWGSGCLEPLHPHTDLMVPWVGRILTDQSELETSLLNKKTHQKDNCLTF